MHPPLSRTRLRRRQRRAAQLAVSGELAFLRSRFDSEVDQRLLLAAPAVAAELSGGRPSTLRRQRRNAALHCFDVPAAEISQLTGRELNAIQRSSSPLRPTTAAVHSADDFRGLLSALQHTAPASAPSLQAASFMAAERDAGNAPHTASIRPPPCGRLRLPCPSAEVSRLPPACDQHPPAPPHSAAIQHPRTPSVDVHPADELRVLRELIDGETLAREALHGSLQETIATDRSERPDSWHHRCSDGRS